MRMASTVCEIQIKIEKDDSWEYHENKSISTAVTLVPTCSVNVKVEDPIDRSYTMVPESAINIKSEDIDVDYSGMKTSKSSNNLANNFAEMNSFSNVMKCESNPEPPTPVMLVKNSSSMSHDDQYDRLMSESHPLHIAHLPTHEFTHSGQAYDNSRSCRGRISHLTQVQGRKMTRNSAISAQQTFTSDNTTEQLGTDALSCRKICNRQSTSSASNSLYADYKNSFIDAMRSDMVTIKSLPAKLTWYVCSDCGQSYADSDSLLKHIKIHRMSLFRCNMCDVKFTNMVALRQHQCMYKNLVFSYCAHCGQQNNICTCRKQTIQFPKNNEQHTDDPCHTHQTNGYSFDSSNDSSLRAAKVDTQISQIRTKTCSFICGTCDQVFSDGNKLRNHINRHQIPVFQCMKCSAKFTNAETLKKHIKAKHSLCRYACNVCNRRFKSIADMRNHSHIKAVRGTRTRPSGETKDRQSEEQSSAKRQYKCSYCYRTFNLLRHLRLHTLKHNAEKSCICNICLLCDKSFEDYAALVKHHSNVHAKYKMTTLKVVDQESPICKETPSKYVNKKQVSYVCSVCSKAYVSVTSLQGHMISHKKQSRICICPECNMKFTNVNALKCHKCRFLAKGYSCSVCNKKFSMQDLRLHLKTHER